MRYLLAALLAACGGPDPSETGPPLPVLEFPEFSPPVDPLCSSLATSSVLWCRIESGWNRGAGWCPTDFPAYIISTTPADELVVRFETELYGVIDVIYEGPIESYDFLWTDVPFAVDNCQTHRLVIADGSECGVCEATTCLGELFSPGDPDGDGVGGFEDCAYCDPLVFPGAPDPPGDGIDQDCDGDS